MDKDCLNCGKEFSSNQPQAKFCCRKCQCKYRKKHYRISNSYICKYCGKEFHPKGYDRTTYCSRECAFADKAAMTKKPKEKKMPVCVICGKEFEGRLNCKYCSDECRKEKKKQRALMMSQCIHNLNIKPRPCKECGIIFKPQYGSKHRKYCSNKCSNRAMSREEKSKRRQQMKRAFVERVYFKKIYQRDKGICQICGEPVEYNRCNKDKMAATIDHVIPLSKGGKHCYDNCQLAHRLCNSLKSDKLDYCYA